MFYVDLETRLKDRFDLAKFMDFTDEGIFDPLNSYMLYQIPLLDNIGEYTIRKEEGRPDNLSYVIYGDTQYWWVLMWYNSIYKPEDLKTGLKIKYPSVSAIEQLYMNASIYQKTV